MILANKYFRIILILTLSLINVINLYSIESIPSGLDSLPTVQYMMQNTNMGTKFYIAIPQNDIKTGQREELLAIFVCSYKDTKVTLSYPRLGIEKTRTVKAFMPTVLSSENNDASFAWEITESEVVTGDAIILTSNDPISVYVLNSKDNSSDGYLAIPTAGWGKKYVHSAYYDHVESAPSNIKRGSGFIVIAAHDGTSVTIALHGEGADLGRTVKNHKIGENLNVTLKAGQTYMVRGNGNTVGFDLTGTTIESSKPVGVISFHQRTMIPNKCPNGRDHINEMLIPVESWGTEFVSVAFNRGTQGDFFRVVTFEDDTRIVADQYNPGSGNALADGHIESVINKGKFWEYLQSNCGSNNKQNGVRGVTVWKSNKPIQVMQLAYSYPWDNDADWDPLMIAVPPVKQFQQSAVFMPSTEGGFLTNELTFLAYGDPNDPQRTSLNTIMLNGEKLSNKYPEFLYHTITGTELFWGRLDIDKSVQSITSSTKFSGYITGFSGYNSYGWPAMIGTNKIDELDTLPPILLIRDKGCGRFDIEATERRNTFESNNPQKDQGLRNIYLISEASYNYKLTLKNPDDFHPELFITQQDFFLEVIDASINAKAYFLVGDRGGNFVIDSVEYIAINPVFSNNKIDFQSKRMYKKHIMEFVTKNNGVNPIVFNTLNFQKNTRFIIENLEAIGSFPFTVAPGDSLKLEISYSPINESNDNDSLIIGTECNSYSIPVSGLGKYPKISSDNWNAGNIEVGKTVCYEKINGNGIRIANEGTDTLHITEIKEPLLPFSISNPTNPPLPIVVPPAQVVYLESLCFSPIDTGKFNTELIFICDDNFGDTITSLNGSAFSKVDVEEKDNNDLFSINPNPPENGVININFNVNSYSVIRLELFDMEGILIEEIYNSITGIGNHNINYKINNLATGVYYIKYTANNEHIIKKIINIRQ